MILTVGTEDADERLDVVLARLIGEPRNRAAARIERGEVTVDGRVATKSDRLDVGQSIEVAQPPEPPSGAAGVPPPPVRFEDEHLMVVAKPAGMVVHPGVGNTAGTMVQALAEAGYRLADGSGEHRPGVVHRLDRGTSGLLVVAKTDAAYSGLVRALARREVERAYVTLAEGHLPARSGRIEVPIGRDPGDRKRFAALRDGKPAVTHWEVERVGGVTTAADHVPVTLVGCRLETGRTHQIRVHLAYAGHPVAGDRTYGARRDLARALGLDRPFLHARRLAFVHPVTGEPVRVDEALPDDLRSALARVRQGD